MDNNRKVRVLHVLKSSIYSGAENVAITIIKYMQDTYDFAYVATDGEIRGVLEQKKIKCYLLSEYNRRGIIRVIKEFEPDIVHAHDFTASILCASISYNFKLISQLHYDPPWSRKWNRKTLIYVLTTLRMSRILVVSTGAFNNMVFAKKLKSKSINVGNPIEVNRILALGNMDNTINKYDLLYVGRLVEQKDPQTFIELVKLVRDKNLQIKCAMLGNGDLWEECKYTIEKYGLQEQVELLGFQENPYVYMKSTKILCVTSKWEGYGLVAAEANVLGIPVISTKTGGVTDIMGENSIELCDGVEEMATKVWKLLSDSGEYQYWQKRAVDRGLKFNSLETYMNQVDKIYKKELR